MVTRNPSDYPQGTVELTVGDYGRLEGQVYFSGPLGKTVVGQHSRRLDPE